jgi:general secretion pathway protein D
MPALRRARRPVESAGIFILIAFFALALFSRALAQEAVRVTDEGVFLDFQDTDLRLVITALAEAGNLNVVYSELPARTVTLRTSKPVSREGIPDLLRSLAESNGLIVIEEGGLMRVETSTPGVPGTATAASESDEEERIFVYRLKHARAPTLAATLQALFGGTSPAGPGERTRRRTLSETLREHQVPPFAPGEEDVDVQVEVGPQGPAEIPGQLSGTIHIVPDELTNSLLVRANPVDWEIIHQTIEALDLRPLQVLIEVLIAEVRRDKALEIGISGEVSRVEDDFEAHGTLVSKTVGDLVLEVMQLGHFDIEATLNALASSGRVRILSRPVILAQNNQEARILVGSERPFIQVFRSLPTDESVRDQVVQFRDVGTSLTIVPTINIDGYVNLEVVQEVSTATSEVQFGAPVISTREAATHLFVRDGQTVVIGGLIENQEVRNRTGVPLLKDIPLLGYLFGTTKNETNRSELFVFLTPHVIQTDEDADQLRQGVEGGVDQLKDVFREVEALISHEPVEGNLGERGPAPKGQNPRKLESESISPEEIPADSLPAGRVP